MKPTDKTIIVAGPGTVIIIAQDKKIEITPDMARKIAGNLPNMADLADTLNGKPIEKLTV